MSETSETREHWTGRLGIIAVLTFVIVAIVFGAHSCEADRDNEHHQRMRTIEQRAACVAAGRDPLACKEAFL